MDRLIKNSSYLILYTIIGLPLGYLLRSLLARDLTVEQFGLFYAMISFFGTIGILNDLGFAEVATYFIPKYLERGEYNKIKTAIKIQLIQQIITTSVIGLGVIIFAQFIANSYFHLESASSILPYMVMYFMAYDLYRYTSTLYYAFQDLKFSGTSEIIRLLVALAFMYIIFALFHNNLVILTLGWGIAHTIVALFYFVSFFIHHPQILKAEGYSILKIYREFLPYTFPTLLTTCVTFLYSSLGVFLLTFFKGVRDVAMYNAAEPISNILLIFVTPITSMLAPLSSQLDEQNNVGKIQKIIYAIFNSGVFFLIPVVILIVLYSTESINILFGSKYNDGSLTLKISAFYLFFTILNKFLYNIITGLGMQKGRFKMISVTAIISTLFSFLLIPSFGSVGVATANTLSQLVLMIGGIYILRTRVKIRLPLHNYAKIFFLSMIFIGFNIYLKTLTAQNFFIQIIIFAAKISLTLLLYYSAGVFILKIVDFHTLKQLFFSMLSINKNNKWYKAIFFKNVNG